MLLGAHMSIAKGLNKAILNALSIGGTTMQIFSRNPRGGKAKKLDSEDIEKSKKLIKDNNFGPWVSHAPYTINLCSSKPWIREYGVNIILEDFQRMKNMGAGFLVIHAGNHTGQGEEIGEKLLIEGLNKILPHCPSELYLLLEGMAGEGSEIGYTFEGLARVMEKVGDNKRLGLCLDTCHMFGAGYDVRKWNELWKIIENNFDTARIKVLHLNDSLYPLGSKRDRHSAIGQGEIGEEGLKEILLHPGIRNMPIILETPQDLSGWAEEIKMIKKWWQDAGIRR